MAVAAYICGPLDDPDLWWHITIGRWIIAHRTVPHVDYWTLFGQGQPWRAYSWSLEILFALVDRFYGIRGLLVFKILMTAALAFSAQYVLVKISRSLGFGSLLAAVYTVSCFNHITLRPQTFIWMLFIWVLYTAHQISAEGASRSRLLRLAVIMCLWANIHISAVLGLALIFMWIASPGHLRGALTATGAAFAGTLFTPYFGGEWLTFFSTSSHPFSFSAIAEFQPATILQYSTVFPLLLVVVLLSAIVGRAPVPPLPRWLLAGLFLIGGLAVLKFIPFAMAILAAMAASIWGSMEQRGALPLFEGIERLIAQVERIPSEGLSFVLIALAIVYLSKPFGNPLNNDVTPVTAIDFIEKHALPFPLLNPFGQGGYVMYRFSDSNGAVSHLPSIDGRTNLISSELWKMHGDALQGVYGWEKYIEAVKPQTILWKAESPLTSILRNNSQWCHVFLAGDYKQGFAIFLTHDEFEKRRGELKADNC